eukprot:scaffold3504_cov240-Pinguiococcus_pyrenoidosus.AAC.44
MHPSPDSRATELAKKVEEAEGLLESNQQVIAWLNKQLNEVNEAQYLGKGRAMNYTTPRPDPTAEIHHVSPTDPYDEDVLGGNTDLANYLDSLVPTALNEYLEGDKDVFGDEEPRSSTAKDWQEHPDAAGVIAGNRDKRSPTVNVFALALVHADLRCFVQQLGQLLDLRTSLAHVYG